MTTMADLVVGQQFPFVSQVASMDATGIGLILYGQQHQEVATISIAAADGSVTGTMAMAPADVPVTVLDNFNLFVAGDILSNNRTGETMVCRWSSTKEDGSVIWGASNDKTVVYSSSGWTLLGHVDPNTLETS